MSVESVAPRPASSWREVRATMLAPLLLGAALIAPASLRSHRPAVVRARAVRADAAWLEPPPVGAWPEALCGPWEVRSSLPNAAETWVELGGDGSVQCASRVGSGAEWSGVEGSDGAWTLSVTLLDKLRRPLVFEGAVRTDSEYHAFSWSGTVTYPSMRKGAPPEKIADFQSFKLE